MTLRELLQLDASKALDWLQENADNYELVQTRGTCGQCRHRKPTGRCVMIGQPVEEYEPGCLGWKP